MKILKILLLFIFTFLTLEVESQNFLEHELSFNAGLYQVRSDYGVRNDSETNFGNQGIAVSLSYYYNPAFNRRKSYFQAHFKYRFNLMYSRSDLEHFGPDSDDPRLASMTGSYTNFTISNGLEYYPLNIKVYKKRSYESFLNDFSPYAGVGLGINFVNPDAESSLPGGLAVENNIFPSFISDGFNTGINLTSDTVLSLNFRTGVRYKLNIRSDVYIESSWMFFDSDFVDGLSPVGPQNKNKDWSWGINAGFSYLIF